MSLVFALILVYILRKKIGIGKVFDNRAASIVKELEQAKHDKEEALKQLAEVEARLVATRSGNRRDSAGSRARGARAKPSEYARQPRLMPKRFARPRIARSRAR